MHLKNLNVGDKYLMSVHGLVPTDKEKDPTLGAETLEIISITGDQCIAKGIASESTYSLTLDDYKNRILKKSNNGHSKKEESSNKLSEYLYIGLIVFLIIISGVKIITTLTQ